MKTIETVKESLKEIIERNGNGWRTYGLTEDDILKSLSGRGRAEDAKMIIRFTSIMCGTKVDSHGVRSSMNSASAKRWFGVYETGKVFECERIQPHQLSEGQFHIDF